MPRFFKQNGLPLDRSNLTTSANERPHETTETAQQSTKCRLYLSVHTTTGTDAPFLFRLPGIVAASTTDRRGTRGPVISCETFEGGDINYYAWIAVDSYLCVVYTVPV